MKPNIKVLFTEDSVQILADVKGGVEGYAHAADFINDLVLEQLVKNKGTGFYLSEGTYIVRLIANITKVEDETE